MKKPYEKVFVSIESSINIDVILASYTWDSGEPGFFGEDDSFD